MFYGNIKDCDVANGPGIRVTLFVSGCTNACPGCFQKQTWDFRYGEAFTDETEQKLLRMLKPSYVRGLTLLGGEPFEPENQRALVPFLKRVRTEAPEKDIWCFTGNRLEELTGAAKDGELIMDGDPRQSRAAHLRCEVTDEMLDLIDVLVDGRFVERLKDLSLEFRGSSNQRLIDLPQTIAKGQIVLWENKASARPLTKSSGKT
ncbi:MAG: anaerobic ribonucleoside-triphosphate reductase activating protein [Firmicutes bacterium]|nr:anaerobic ribonucleoside-triphosphate reductase activating protein [Bacillota bacterium]